MKRAVLVLAIVALALVGVVPAAAAGENQPGKGERSTGRNEAGFGGGPHCHVLVEDGNQDQFDHIRVFPSHTGHDASGLSDGPFAADGDCDGQP